MALTVITMPTKKKRKQQERKPTAYDRSQHQLICQFLGVSDSPDAQENTAFEAVVQLQLNYEAAHEVMIKRNSIMTSGQAILARMCPY